MARTPFGELVPTTRRRWMLGKIWQRLAAIKNGSATCGQRDLDGVGRHHRRRSDGRCKKHPALLMVDTVSSPFPRSITGTASGAWTFRSAPREGIDAASRSTTPTAISKKSLAASKTSTMPKSFWRWDDMLEANTKGFFPYTPATNLFYGLKEALALLHEEGLRERVTSAADARRRNLPGAVRAQGLEICALEPCEYSDTVT